MCKKICPRSHRLVVRTPPSQGGNTGSSPVGSAIVDYTQKFDSFRNKTLYEQLGSEQQAFIRRLAFKYLFSFQEFRQVGEASRDLGMWGETSLETWWQHQSLPTTLKGTALKKRLLANLQAHLKALKASPKSYPRTGMPPLKQRQTPNIMTKHSDKKIEGFCPVASPKTVCCNLRTIDAVENCPYACSYCSIQTFYTDNAVFDADFAAKLKAIAIDPDRFYHYGTGQASDSLAWGDRNGILTELCQFAADHPNILLEFKTKSKNIQYFLEHDIPENVVCSWSLNTSAIIANEERFTASLEQRLDAARQLADRDIAIAFHFHPMVYYEGCEEEYVNLASQTMRQFQPNEVLFLSFGTVTLIKPVIKKIRRLGNPTKILQMDFVPDPHGKLTYPDEIKIRLFKTLYDALEPWRDDVFMYLCMEKASIWQEVFGYVYDSNEIFEAEFGSRTIA